MVHGILDLGADHMIDGAIFGYLGTLWCIAQLVYAIFRGQAQKAAIYGIALFAAAVIALNVGGILNDATWNLFGIGIFGAHTLYSLFIVKSPIHAVIFAMMFAASVVPMIGGA